jgi:hypothetical protein
MNKNNTIEQTTASSSSQSWRVICPPKNWRKPISVESRELELLEQVAQRLELVTRRDDKLKKFYLGPPKATPAVNPSQPVNGLRFANGWTADVIDIKIAGAQYQAVDVEAAAPLIPAFPDAQISKNFRLSEFRPGEHSYDYMRLSPMLVETLEDIRQQAGDLPLHVTSGYRPPAYNRKVGGVSNSTHIDGIAADIYADHLSTDALYTICDQIIGDKGGVGYYPNQGFVHIDLRGYHSRW